ncbi:MAG: YhjD/YihY/BrkB family envelope integrity protein [Syntrophales bacterium]|nr:YhjD/YihY/BrkB family envelope integrity protein [Syntrophales bacterium]
MMNPSRNERGKKATPGVIRLRFATSWDILSNAIRNYRTNGDTNQAAAIALYAILSIIPLFILTLLLVGHTFGADPGIQKKLLEGIRQFIPSFSGALLTQFGQIEGKKELLGWAGIISLIWFSAMIFSAIETALNIIFRSRTRRNYFLKKILAIAMIPLGWTVGVLSVGITYVATILSRQPLLVQGGVFFLPEVYGIFFRYLLPYFLTVLFFTFVYKVIPSGKVSLKSALIGSAIFSALMEIAKQFFAWYITSYTRYHVIFGSLEAVVILVIWVFYVALILLFCAELISSYQRRDMILLEKALLKPRRGRMQVDERLFRKFGRLYGPDEYIFREGDIGQDIFYVLGGRVRMEKSAGQAKKVLAEMGPGEYFGEMAALIHAPRTASARSLEESHIAVVNGDTLRSLLRDSDDVSLFMLKEFSNRIRHTNEALEELTQSWVRLIATLYFLKVWPLPDDRNPDAELARITGKETAEIHEILAELGRRGVLTFSEDRVTGFSRDDALRLLDEEATV